MKFTEAYEHLAALWAIRNTVQLCEFRVTAEQWRKHGGVAGHLRNSAMLRATRTRLLVAFPGGAGTNNCVTAAKGLGIELQDERAFDADSQEVPITARIEREPDPLTFTDALALLDRGRKVRRRAWRAAMYIWFPNPLESRFVALNGRNGPIRWSPYAEDFGAVDWEEVP